MTDGPRAALDGLGSIEAAERLQRDGPNRIPERHEPAAIRLLRRLWGPVPWMLEASFVLELVLGRYTQAAIIAVLLVVNALIAFFEEGRARDALALLRARLSVRARVLRDGAWQTVDAAMLVRGDVIHARMGDIVPADLDVLDGHASIDQSSLTGESVAVDVERGSRAHSASVVVRGELTGRVAATGASTFFGRTAELVRIARPTGHAEAVILRVVRALVLFDVALVAVVAADAVAVRAPMAEIVPFALMLLIASVPVALPATFSLTMAVGASELARRGVLVTRLSAIEAAAAMDLLCTDKTGTLTENRLALRSVVPLHGASEGEVLEMAALASAAQTQDPLDLAILDEARARGVSIGASERVAFVPFDPATRRSEAIVRSGAERLRIVKGAPHVVFELAGGDGGAAAEVIRLGVRGQRVLAVAAGAGTMRLVGLLGFEDPPRGDARETVVALGRKGVRTMMLTGDGPATARAIATQVGIDGPLCEHERLRTSSPDAIEGYAVFASVLPEDKFALVERLQRRARVVGMTGDGVNDAPALKQADVGIAVANATDVARAAAAVVLTRPGLGGVLDAIRTGREVFQRLLTYTVNKIVKTFHITLFLGLGFLALGTFVVGPRHVLLLLLTNDFVTMSLSRDRVEPSPRPDRWDIRRLARSALLLALAWVAFSLGVLAVGRHVLHLPAPALQTANFLGLVFSGQATVYLVRERRAFHCSRPGGWLLLATALDLLLLGILARGGILIAPIPLSIYAALLVATMVFAVGLDAAKVRLLGVRPLESGYAQRPPEARRRPSRPP